MLHWRLLLIAISVLPLAACAPQPEAACPDPSAGTHLYLDENAGFCFLYTDDYVLTNTDEGKVFFNGPRLVEHPSEPLDSTFIITFSEVDPNTTPAEAAARNIELSHDMEGFYTMEAVIGGKEALIIDPRIAGVPPRDAYVISGNTLFVIIIAPGISPDG
jgi:hypothetical protein